MKTQTNMALSWVTWHDTWRSLAQVISGPCEVWLWFQAFICWSVHSKVKGISLRMISATCQESLRSSVPPSSLRGVVREFVRSSIFCHTYADCQWRVIQMNKSRCSSASCCHLTRMCIVNWHMRVTWMNKIWIDNIIEYYYYRRMLFN